MLALQSNTTGDLRPSEKIPKGGNCDHRLQRRIWRACKPRLVGKQ